MVIEDETKADFARRTGLSRARITQLSARGLPLTADGRVKVAEALAWMSENLDPAQRTAQARVKSRPALVPSTDGGNSATRAALWAEHEAVKIERARVALEKERGKLVDRTEIGRAVFAFARSERDAWLAWSARTAPLLAAQLGADARAVAAALDRAVAEHLHELADAPMPEALTHE